MATLYDWGDGKGKVHTRKKGAQYRSNANPFVNVTLKKALPGTYDASLDQAERAAKRGLGDLIEDTTRQGEYDLSDLITAEGDITRQRGELDEDIGTARTRALADYLTQRQGVERNYQRLGNAQGQQFQAAGLAEGGAGEQATIKRAANRQLEDTAINTAEGRTLDDLLRQQVRGGQALDRAGGALTVPFQRNVFQRQSVTVPRAQRELGEFQTDTAQARMQQYSAAGGLPSLRVRRSQAKKWKRAGVI